MSNYHRSIFSLLLIKILIGCNRCYKLNGHSESVWCWRHRAKNYTPGALDFRHGTFGTRNEMPICGTKRAVTMRYMVRSVLKMLLHQIAYIPNLLYDVFGVFLRWTQSTAQALAHMEKCKLAGMLHSALTRVFPANLGSAMRKTSFHFLIDYRRIRCFWLR